MTNFICAIPAALADYWWTYEILLVAIIVIGVFLMSALKKKTDDNEARYYVVKAKNKLQKSAGMKGISLQNNMYVAKNLVKNAVRYYHICVDDRGMLQMKNDLEIVTAALDVLSQENLEKTPDAQAEKYYQLSTDALHILSNIDTSKRK